MRNIIGPEVLNATPPLHKMLDTKIHAYKSGFENYEIVMLPEAL